MVRQRLRSPLRWLWAIMSALAIGSATPLAGTNWLLLAILPVSALLLMAPPVWIFRHDETPPPRTGVSLEVRETRLPPGTLPGSRCFSVTLVNPGDVPAEGYRVRILVPEAIWPKGSAASPLAHIHAGAFARHWSIESIYSDTSVTFRSQGAGEGDAIICPAGGRVDLVDLVLVNLEQHRPGTLEYQINGGTVRTVLGRLELPG